MLLAHKIGRFDVVAEYFIDDNSNYNYYITDLLIGIVPWL
jgi:hypothetical protein